MKLSALMLFSAAVMMLCSCKDGADALLPKSGGRSYEVLVVAKNDTDRSLMDSLLTQNVPGLPQNEPLFDVSFTDSEHLDRTAKTVRAIVFVTVDSLRFTSTKIRYEKNVWAKPQMVVYVNTPSTAALKRDMIKNGRMLIDLLTRAEINNTLSTLKRDGNRRAEKYINKVFDISMKIPTDMKSEKRGKDFIWLSDNAASGMRSICVYTYPGKALDITDFISARDSIMKANIPGERDGMYMQTAAESVETTLKKEKGRTVMECRGLWEMHGDAMGGPFVALAEANPANGKITVTEAFVYAPEMKKRNLIRQTEAALYSNFFN